MTAELSPASLAFLPFALPICLYIVWTDLKFMRIPNVAVMALFAVYVVIGPFVLELETYAWRFLGILIVLVIGFVLNIFAGLGAGDAKFAAVMAAFIPASDVTLVCYLFTALLLAAFATHRLARRLPWVRRQVPDWQSWTRRDFPMGIALGPTLAIYLALPAFF